MLVSLEHIAYLTINIIYQGGLRMAPLDFFYAGTAPLSKNLLISDINKYRITS
jgi:hypothetical protein